MQRIIGNGPLIQVYLCTGKGTPLSLKYSLMLSSDVLLSRSVYIREDPMKDSFERQRAKIMKSLKTTAPVLSGVNVARLWLRACLTKPTTFLEYSAIWLVRRLVIRGMENSENKAWYLYIGNLRKALSSVGEWEIR